MAHIIHQIFLITSCAVDTIRNSYYIHGPQCNEKFFAAIYVNLLRDLHQVIKTTVFYKYIVSFSNKFTF